MFRLLCFLIIHHRLSIQHTNRISHSFNNACVVLCVSFQLIHRIWLMVMISFYFSITSGKMWLESGIFARNKNAFRRVSEWIELKLNEKRKFSHIFHDRFYFSSILFVSHSNESFRLQCLLQTHLISNSKLKI